MSKDELLAIFRDNLRSLRTLRGLTQTAVARQCGWTPSYVSQLENGLTVPSVEAIAALSLALHVAPSVLLTADAFSQTTPPPEKIPAVVA
jgi:transcriptional regulator with XRE-family HTH domain